MGQAADSHSPPVAVWKWQLVGLMFLATMINYMDRQTLGSVSKPFMREYKLDEEGFGWVEFWFGMTFGVTQLVSGAMADRVSIRWLYAATLLIWSAAGFSCGLVHTLPLFIMCRVVLGFGESFNWPCAVAAVSRVFPPESRSFANSIFHGGASIGAIVTPFVVIALVGSDGENWRHVFLVTGGVGALWVVGWLWFVRGERAAAIDTSPIRSEHDNETVASLFINRKVWIALLVGLCVNLFWHFFRTWLPRIYEKDLHFDERNKQLLLALYYICADMGGMTAGYITRRLARTGRPLHRARQIVMFGTGSLCLLAIPGALTMTPWVTVPLFCIVGGAALGGFPNYFNLCQDVSARHTAQVLGITGAVGWCSVGAINPLVGKVADHFHSFTPAIIVLACLPLVGACIGLAWPKR
jgi:ACS family hexuronate transporter-like MFS transporter